MRNFILASLLFTFTATTQAQSPQFNVTQYRAGFAKETLTVSSVAKILTAATYAPTVTGVPANQTRADYCLITVETDSIRYWPTGSAPTSAQGHLITAGGSFYIYGYNNIKNLQMIRVTTDATVQVSYYRFFSNTP